jgi:hypothetical protein
LDGGIVKTSAPGVKKFPTPRLVPEGLTSDKALQFRAAAATVCLLYAIAEQSVILPAQVIVRIKIRRFALQRLAALA